MIDSFWARKVLVPGLCPNKVFREVQNVSTLYLATSIAGDDNRSHLSCQYGRWTRLIACSTSVQLDTLPFRRSSCLKNNCESAAPDAVNYTMITKALSQGSYPLCEIVEQKGEPQLCFFDSQGQDRDYVAVSHVW